jgi:uncharacterized membrane protein
MKQIDSQNAITDYSIAEQNVYTDVYQVLLWGMLVSTALFAVGIVRALFRPGYIPLDTRWVRGHYDWPAVWKGVAHADPTYLMLLATVVLIATPVLRVAVSVYAFWVDGDLKYVMVTSAVLAVIGLTVVLAHFGLH